jgi:hypothetical protein
MRLYLFGSKGKYKIPSLNSSLGLGQVAAHYQFADLSIQTAEVEKTSAVKE